MSTTSKLRLTRRSVIKGAGGVALALPWLEAMGDRKPARAASSSGAPARFLAVYTPGGTVLDKWRPTGTSETSFALSPILSPFAPVQDRLIVLDGLYMKCGDQSAFNVEQHEGGMVGWLTGMVQPGAGHWVTGPSIDQALASRLGAGKRYPSLQMAVRWGTGKGHGKMSPLNTCTFSDAPAAAPIPPRIDIADAWKTLFGSGVVPPAALGRWDASVLDAVERRYVKLAQRLGAADRQRLEAHLERIRALEARLAPPSARSRACAAPPLTDISDYNPSAGLNSADTGQIKDPVTDAAIPKVGKLMMDMMVMALACDLTSVGLLQWSDSAAEYTLPWLGLPETHMYYQNDGGYQPVPLQQIYTWYSSQHAYLLQALAAVDMGGHSLLDETVVFFGTEAQSPATHDKKNMPFLIAGGGSSLRTGRWLRYPDNPPHNNLLVSLLNLFGDARTTFGDPRCVTGPLPNLV